MKTKTKLWLATISALVAGVGGLAGIKAGQIGSMISAGKSFRPPPESVSAASVEATEWQPILATVGSLVAVHGVTLSAELPGLVREVTFASGTEVKRGAILVKLDVSTEVAELAATEAETTLAQSTLERSEQLRQSGAITAAELDQVRARAQQAAAHSAALRATIAKKTIQAPFDGRISMRQVERGQVLAPGTPIATVQSVDPIYAEFWLAQRALAETRVGQQVLVLTDTFPGRIWDAKIEAVDTQVDAATRNVRFRATVGNADGLLRPGMYVNVEVLTGDKRPVLSIPATAVIYAPYGDSVFMLKTETDPTGAVTTIARQQFVRLGERRGDLVAVVAGLSPGDSIVGSGAFKLRNGSAVVVNNDLAPTASLAPQPTDD